MRHVKLRPDEYPDSEVCEIALGIHDAFQKLARGAGEALVQEDLDRLRIRFNVLLGPGCC